MLYKVKEKSKITLPEELIHDWQLEEGDKVEIISHEGGVFVRPIALLSKARFEKINNIVKTGENTSFKKKLLNFKSNVSFKAVIRQPIRMLIFLLLVGLATFGFVSRVVEYAVLSREINRIEQFYRTAGTLVPIDPIGFNNVYEAANLLANSNLIEFHDRRTVVQGVMHGHASGMRGFGTLGGNIFQRGEQRYSYKGLYPFDTFLIVELVGSIRRPLNLPDMNETIITNRITLRPVQIIAGHDQFLPGRRYMADLLVDENGNSIASGLVHGGRYLIRAMRQDALSNTIEIFPVMDGLYFVSVDDKEGLDNVWSTLSRELHILDANTNMLMLQGTKDMTTLPMVQSQVIERRRGRFLTYSDYANANHVMVVPERLARLLGETVTLTLRDMRTFTDGSPLPPEDHHMRHRLIPGVEGLWRNMPAGYWVSIPRDYEGAWRRYPTVEIEVMVVGTYFVSDAWGLPRWAHIRDSFRNIEVFVPASIIPDGFGIVDAHIVSGAYNFVLSSPRDQAAFLVRYRDRLEYMGFMVQFSGADPTNFWRSAGPIRNAIRLNLALFSAVLTVVLALTVFVYLRQRYKEFAIMRAMGVSDGNTTWQVIAPVLVLWIPIVIIASIAAWQFALVQVDTGMEVLAEIDVPYDTAEEYTPMNILQMMRYEAERAAMEIFQLFSVPQIILLCAALAAAWIAAVFIGVRFFAGQSMILLLQSAQGSAPVRMAKETAPPKAVKISDVFLFKPIVLSFEGRVRSRIRHHWRHILRAPVKSVLVVGMALLFVAALGWLDRTITVTESEIVRLHATTVITGEVVEIGAGADGDNLHGHHIPWGTLDILRDSGFVEDYYFTTLHQFSVFPYISLPPGIILDRNMFIRSGLTPPPEPILDFVKGISCWDTFVYKSSRPTAFGVGRGGEFTVTFAPGYSEADFVPVPPGAMLNVIVHESLMERDLLVYRGGLINYRPNHAGARYLIEQRLSLGDTAYFGVSWSPNNRPVRIIGVYSGGHPRSAYHMGQGLILRPMLIESDIASLTFTVYQDKVMYLNDFEQEMALQLTGSNHRVILNDAELRLVVAPLEDNLNLLRMLYPVMTGLSFVLALGLNLLLMLQNAKNAAILRVLGMPRHKTRSNLCMELLTMSVAGVIVGFMSVPVMGVAIGTVGVIAGIYLAGAVMGTVAGVMVISQKVPMELLQVRE
ncbi:MAG: AbrB/MazE/SpoVT family DNA-binding domain-containing protein [Firmicutes bacterium]|nr:AbrB/MazE/SpoVT family DNA-binding domain-containing protein [Bacillota bacterium]